MTTLTPIRQVIPSFTVTPLINTATFPEDIDKYNTEMPAVINAQQRTTNQINRLLPQLNTLETNVSAMEASAVSASAAAVGAANYQGTWTSKGYTVGQTVSDVNGIRWLCKLTHTTAQIAAEGTYWTIAIPYVGAIGNINSPVLDMPLKNSLAMKAGVGSVTFTRASTATYIDRYGVLKSAATNEPRFEKEGYLHEGASTNLLTYSEDFSNAYWYKEASTLTANTTDTLDPYGTNLADKIMETAVTSTHALYTPNSIPFTAGVTYCQSWFIKPNGRTKFRVTSWTGEAFTTSRSILIDLVAKTSTVIEGTVLSHGIIELANGWFRVWFSATADATGTQFGAMIRPRFDDGLAEAYLGDVTKGFFAFGAQLEALPFASSYILTVASTASRANDILKVDFNNNTCGYKNRFSEESISIDFRKFASTSILRLFTTDANNSAYRMFITSNSVVGQYGSGTAGGSQLPTGILQNYVFNRLLLTHNTVGATKMYANGVLAASGNSGTVNSDGTPTGLWFGSEGGIGSFAFGHITNVRIWNKALTATEVALA